MRVTHLFRVLLALVACAVLGLTLLGCQDSSGFRSIPPGFAGPYEGFMSPSLGSTRQDTIVTDAAILANIRTDGTVVFNVSSIEGDFTATGGINQDGRLTATGTLNGNVVTFTGTWAADGFGHASGTWRNETTGITGSWAIEQQGVSTPSLATEYTGTFTEGTITGTLLFTIQPDGSLTGTATGFGVSQELVTLTGGINLEDQIVMTGTYDGEPVFFLGSLNTATRTVTDGFAASGLNGGIVGTWAAEPQ